MLPAPAACAAPLTLAFSADVPADGGLALEGTGTPLRSGLIWGVERALPMIDPPKPGSSQPLSDPTASTPTSAARARARLLVGPQLGLYAPFSGRTRASFGKNWFNVGFGLGPVIPPRPAGQVEFDLNFLSSRTHQSDAFLAPMGVLYRRSFPARSKNVVYAGVSANALLTVLRSEADQLSSGIRVGYGAGLMAGMTAGDRAYVETRFYQFSKIRGFDLSGLSVAAGLRF